MKYNKKQEYKVPKSQMRKDGTSKTDYSDEFSKTRAQYARVFFKRPKIETASNDLGDREDASREQARYRFLNRKVV